MISIIAALDKNRGIGKNNAIPWHIPEDIKHFKETTMGHPVIMGRKTYESIGHPLSGRVNIVVTRDKNYACAAKIVYSLDEAISYAKSKDQKEIFIIGGGELYRQAINRADRLYLTIIDHAFDVDAYFPEYESQFKEVESKASRDGNYSYAFKLFERKR
ncbi:MAG TPA: dihydrofolate reductase [Patescibacteria group bacterium]|nr:dihydrofolate reductase [Patescibacteria group bacterium]